MVVHQTVGGIQHQARPFLYRCVIGEAISISRRCHRLVHLLTTTHLEQLSKDSG